jgi:hypothetical protein
MPAPVSEASRLLGERLRAARLRAACSQDEIANLAGMNVANYGKIERGLGNPSSTRWFGSRPCWEWMPPSY